MRFKFFYIYSFCFITKGRNYFSIYDSMHKKMHKFDMELYDIAKHEFRNKTVQEILSVHNAKDKEVIVSFIQYLRENEIGRYVDNIYHFPLLNEHWDSPYRVKRCIIDIRDIWHNLDIVFVQLSKLLCPKVEIRVYRLLQLKEIEEIIKVFQKYDFGALFLLFPYSDSLFADNSAEHLSNIIKNDYRIFFNIYGITDEIELHLNEIKEKYIPLSYNITTSKKIITGKDDCGVINCMNLHEMSIEEIMENKYHNGCLNRLISIDECGQIKNCPSMCKSYGHINTDSLIDIYETDEFRKYWGICNSMIEECKDCELRVICLGCRAYLSDPSNLYSKPKKCHYIP